MDISGLPREVWQTLIRFLNKRDVLMLRIICKRCKYIVDSIHEFWSTFPVIGDKKDMKSVIKYFASR